MHGMRPAGFCLFALTIAAILTGTPGEVSADPGPTSQQEMAVTVVIGARVQISRLTDIDLGSYDGSGDLLGSSQMCVHRNDTGIYDISVSSSHADTGTFQVANGTSFIPYSVDFSDASGTTFTAVASGERLTGLVGSLSRGCVGQGNPGSPGPGNPGSGPPANMTPGGPDGPTNATLDVRFSESDLQSATQGSYADVITLLVEPG